MPVPLSEIRDLLLPGLWEISTPMSAERWSAIFVGPEPLPILPLPPVPLPVAVAMGAAAVVIKNPVVSRRFLP
jgi:hypothetical protein